MRLVNGVIDLRPVKPETLEKYEKARRFREADPDLPMKHHCWRAGISVTYFWQIKKSLRALSCGSLAANQTG
jgi:hypothetical protein